MKNIPEHAGPQRGKCALPGISGIFGSKTVLKGRGSGFKKVYLLKQKPAFPVGHTSP